MIPVLVIAYVDIWCFMPLDLYDFYHWNSYAIVGGNLIVIILASRYLFELLTGKNLVSLKRNSDFWIAIGVVFFACCELPLTGMINFLIKDKNWPPVRKLFVVLQIINIVMYSIFIYAYLCRGKPIVKKSL